MFSFKKKSTLNLVTNEKSSEMKERLFFHDLINQTHGLILFLDHKIMSEKVISSDEILLIKQEIKTLQSLVKDHYDFKHKNLNQTYDWVSFDEAKHAFETLSNTYFSNIQVTVTYQNSNKNLEADLIYYPCFYRILNNMIKNISESGCTQVAVTFKINESELSIETKNQMHKSAGLNTSEHLSRVILDEKVTPLKSMGLDSIHHLAEAHGGSFTFEITDHTWINQLKLPTKKSTDLLKTVKTAA